ncbi:hypothetical protein ACFQJ7_01090 [Halovenus rubra]|uniref:Uncharacterized protein n=2 Tax=Halovenus rubra TaxID=869890 RepID=A0ABD5X4X0_9EURY|nr:hypothetical protein [Halovenus rubra]
MEWKRVTPPSQLRSCSCGCDYVDEKPDGLVKLYRCSDCHTILGDLTMGHEP